MPDKHNARTRAAVLKQLRAEHAATFERTQALLKKQKQVEKQIRQVICDNAKSVPEIAVEVDMPCHEVLWYLTAYKKYDLVIENGMCGEYVRYQWVEGK
jgi:hypothetical protein